MSINAQTITVEDEIRTLEKAETVAFLNNDYDGLGKMAPSVQSEHPP
jgi:hypothetical protein